MTAFLHSAGILLASLVYGMLGVSILRSLREPSLSVGRVGHLAKLGQFGWKMAVFVLVILLYACLCVVLWIPVPIGFSTGLMTIATWIGLLGYFAGLGLLVWGRYALGRSYGVASSLGASIRPDHELVVSGPYAYLRHPMYLGLLIFTFSGFMVYRTWTFIFLALNFLSLFSRARQEERLMRQA